MSKLPGRGNVYELICTCPFILPLSSSTPVFLLQKAERSLNGLHKPRSETVSSLILPALLELKTAVALVLHGFSAGDYDVERDFRNGSPGGSGELGFYCRQCVGCAAASSA